MHADADSEFCATVAQNDSPELERLTATLEALRDRWLRASSPTEVFLCGDALRDLLRRENTRWRAGACASVQKNAGPDGQ